jgi:benzil reductase ((S)-benzoin forming)
MNVLITDTSSGFGNALAREFLETGATVYGISPRSNDSLNSYADYHHLTQNLMQLDEVRERLNNFVGGVNEIDLAILNAGMLPEFNDIRKTPIEKITTVMNVNLLANKLIIDTLLERVPHVYQIVAISSGTAISGDRGWNAYAISKAALNTLMKLYAREIPETHFSAIEPGIIDGVWDEGVSRATDKTYQQVNGLDINLNGRITNPEYAANYLVEAMGIVLQEESGTYTEVKDLLLAPELGN